MLSLNFWNILWTVVNVLVLYLALKKFLFKPILNTIQAREDMIQGQFAKAKKNQEQAVSAKEEYEERLHTVKEEAEQILLTARERAEAEKERMLIETKRESDQMLEKAQKDIQAEQEKAERNVQNEIAKLAMGAARKIIEAGDIYDADSRS